MKEEIHHPWFAQQRWENIIFIHFPVPPYVLKPHIPQPFLLDLYEGQAWVSVVAFQALQSRLRGMPKILSIPPFLQINIRTYVTSGVEKGVYFLTIYANRRLPVFGARLFSLPFQRTNITFSPYYNQFQLQQKDNHKTPLNMQTLDITFQAGTRYAYPKKGSLDYWLTERNRLWLIHRSKILCVPVTHESWRLTNAAVQIDLTHDSELFQSLPQEKIFAHYAPLMDSYLHPFISKDI